MSVEKELAEASVTSDEMVHDSKATMFSETEELTQCQSANEREEATVESIASTTEVPIVADEEILETLPIDDVEISAARVWFESLSCTERAAAIGFMDGRFLETLRIIFSSSWSQTQSSSRDGLITEKLNASDVICLDEFERLHDALGDNLERTEGPSDVDVNRHFEREIDFNSSDRPNECNVISSDVSAAGEGNEGTKIQKSMSYRIPEADFGEGNEFTSCTKLLDQCRAIFPSSFMHVTGEVVDDVLPYVTLLEANIAGNVEENTLQLFDNIACSYFGSKFLLWEMQEPALNDKLWLTRLRRHCNDRPVALAAILLAKFEYSAVRYFSKMKDGIIIQQSKTEADVAILDAVNAIETESSNHENAEEVTEVDSRLPSMLNDIFGRSRALNDLNLAMDTEAMNSLMTPFTEVFGLSSADFSSCGPGFLIMTPLKLVLGSSPANNYICIDQGIKKALSGMPIRSSEAECTGLHTTDKLLLQSPIVSEENHSLAAEPDNKVETGPEVLTDNNDDVMSDTNSLADSDGILSNVGVQQRPSPSKSSKKKKKKSKKHKNRKSLSHSKESPQESTKDDDLKEDISELPQIILDVIDQPIEASRIETIPSSAQSFDSADPYIADVESKDNDVSARDEDVPHERTDEITVSHSGGRVIITTPTVETSGAIVAATSEGSAVQEVVDVAESDDGDAWETVETRKANKKKGGERPAHGNPRVVQLTNSGSIDSQGGIGKKPKSSRTAASRRKNANRKMVRDILLSVVDDVEDESLRKKSVPTPPLPPPIPSSSSSSRPAGNPWKNGPPGKNPIQTAKVSLDRTAEPPAPVKTLRDVVLGTHRTSPKKNLPTTQAADVEKRLPRVDEAACRTNIEKTSNSSGKNVLMMQGKAPNSAAGDQNTAPTYQETISAVSSSSNVVVSSKDNCRSDVERIPKSDSSSGDTHEAPKNLSRKPSVKSEKDVTPTPPLPTLLSPENANSSTSSVASSLEAPHVVHTHHHSKSAPSTNDVGYHLLDVCERLSRDMSLFMSRRTLALNPRRVERGALLAALQESVSSLWPSPCRVELYGSCAIELDLPSSDLDVVVVGLDPCIDMMMNQAVPVQSSSRSLSSRSENPGEDYNAPSGPQHQTHMQLPPVNPYLHMPGLLNGERVLRLAAKLESQPWAVQVKAIPSASVPVVKILADPSRLAGASNVGDWRSQNQSHVSSSDVNGQHLSGTTSSLPVTIDSFETQTTFLPWRGLDVVKGLLALDITFEGPGHGGIGSTEFSSRVIEEACLEYGLHQDSTPFVQVLMVLKELLAQRKLNEPYSGGLSSYALLLLVLALLRERAVIKQEIERVERQRRAMAAGDGAAFGDAASSVPRTDQLPEQSRDATYQHHQGKSVGVAAETKTTGGMKSQPPPSKTSNESDGVSKRNPTKPQVKPSSQLASCDLNREKKAPNSWATVAKKASFSTVVPKHPNPSKQHSETQVKPSFADAVAKSPSTNINSSQPLSQVDSNKKKASDDQGESSRETNMQAPTAGAASTNDAVRPNFGSASTNSTLQSYENPGVDTVQSSLVAVPAFYPQGVNDIIEVLCSGETTAGKLLMHFLLFYGQYFDAQTTAIDISGKHVRDSISYSQHISPFIQRRAPGSIDPITGMLIVDPIVVYDPLEGAENNNVARRCFAWNSVRWIFAQSYATLSSAVERSATPPATPNWKIDQGAAVVESCGKDALLSTINPDVAADLWDPKSPLLSSLLSF